MLLTLDHVAVGGHVAAAVLFAALAAWQAHRGKDWDRVHVSLTIALGVTSIWALMSAFNGPGFVETAIAETIRNGAWLLFMYCLLTGGDGQARPRSVDLIYVILTALLAMQIGVDLVMAQIPPETMSGMSFEFGNFMPRMIFAVGALLLVHNLYTISSPEARWGISLPMAALAAMWTYDLNLYTIAYLTHVLANELIGLRGVAIMTVAPILGMAMLRTRTWNVRLSRSAAFQSISLSVIGAYLIVMFVLANAIEYIGGNYVVLAQVTLIFAMCVVALLVIPSGGFRSWLRVQIAKHFFKHRYDYRAEWMRFTETMGKPGPDALPLDLRVIQAVANISQSRAGLLFIADRDQQLRLRTRWNWEDIDVADGPFPAALIRLLGERGYIVELDSVRSGRDKGCPRDSMPPWLLDTPAVWAIVPFIHFDRLVGLAVLAAPASSRSIDWEDLDMFRVVGRQVASYLAEATGQQALIEAQQFDNLNRRFAFIVHDIKNLVSQLSLVASNAKRHADNPEFRSDMIDTLQSSVGKMNALLARLSQHNKGRPAPARSIDLMAVIRDIVERYRAVHPLETEMTVIDRVHADPVRVETILGHLIQNAIEASPSGRPVLIRISADALWAQVEVIDQGVGMDEAFVRDQLFKPFNSTKEGGFGIGAFEAMTLAQSLGGKLAVESRKDRGSRFVLNLPFAVPDAEFGVQPDIDAMVFPVTRNEAA